MSRLSCIVASALFCVATANVNACCLAHAELESVELADERVIIVWNEAAKMQHFVRQARFDTEANDFGFIVPTPSVPTLAVADPAAFTALASLVHAAETKGMDAAPAAAADGVEVIRKERVGDYDATIVRATDGKALNQWLKDNGYSSRPAMEEWLDYYAKKEWVFTAFKFLKDEPTGTWTQAIRVSFKTDQARYPYKMPKDTWPDGHVRPMKVYFVAERAFKASYVETEGQWEAEEKWTGDIPEYMAAQLATDLKLKESDIPEGAVLTVLENDKNPDGYDHDLYFAATADRGFWLWVGGAAAAVLLILLMRRKAHVQTMPA